MKHLSIHTDAPADIAARIHAAIVSGKDRNRVVVAVLDTGRVTFGPAHKGLIAKLLKQPDAARYLVGTYNRQSAREQIESDLAA